MTLWFPFQLRLTGLTNHLTSIIFQKSGYLIKTDEKNKNGPSVLIRSLFESQTLEKKKDLQTIKHWQLVKN